MGTRWNRPAEAVPTSTHNLCFEQKYEKYQSFLSEIFIFFGGKISIIFEIACFVMSKLNFNTNCNTNFSKLHSDIHFFLIFPKNKV